MSKSYDVLSFKSYNKQLNDITFTDYYYRLMLLSRSVFKWNNLPYGIDEKWIEKFLYTEGFCIFFKDPEKGFMVAKANREGDLNYYDEPTRLRPYGTNYFGESLENNVDCVIIRNNDVMFPTYPTIELYAYRLADITRTIDININAQRTPVTILCSERQKNTMKNVYKQYAGNEPVIYADKDLNLENIKTIDTQAPVVFDKLQLQKHAIWNECMTFLGISNANQDKKERLVTDEVNANNEQIEMSAQVMLKARQQACDLINEMFGLNISVELRNVVEQVENDSEDLNEKEEGEEDVR